MRVVLALIAAAVALRWASYATSRRRVFEEVAWALASAGSEFEESEE